MSPSRVHLVKGVSVAIIDAPLDITWETGGNLSLSTFAGRLTSILLKVEG